MILVLVNAYIYKRSAGFTLLELVVVISIIAIISVIAMPRMISNYDDAHQSTIVATSGALSSAVLLVRTQWVAMNVNGAVDAVKHFGNGDIATTPQGWPSDAQRGERSIHNPQLGDDVSRCVRLWQSLLETRGITVSGEASQIASYVAKIQNATTCTYTYQLNDSNSRIEYDLSNGSVSTVLH